MKYLALLLALVLPLSGQTLTNTTLDGVTNATINGKLDDDVSATHAALNLGPAATIAFTPQKVVNVKDFGAVGDGVTDDTRACQAAALTIGDGTGGILYFPKGTYVFTEAASSGTGAIPWGASAYSGTTGSTSPMSGQRPAFQVYSNMTICGDGIGVTTLTLKDTELAHPFINVPGTTNVRFHDLTIDGNRYRSGLRTPYYEGENEMIDTKDDARNLIIERVKFKNVAHEAIDLDNDEWDLREPSIFIRDCIFEDIGGEAVHNATWCIIERCVFRNCSWNRYRDATDGYSTGAEGQGALDGNGEMLIVRDSFFYNCARAIHFYRDTSATALGQASGMLTFTATPTAGDTVTVGAKTYTFVSSKSGTLVAATDRITSTAHGLADGAAIQFVQVPGGFNEIAVSVTMYIRDVTTNDFKLANTLGGAAIDLSLSAENIASINGTGLFFVAGSLAANTVPIFDTRAKTVQNLVFAINGGDQRTTKNLSAGANFIAPTQATGTPDVVILDAIPIGSRGNSVVLSETGANISATGSGFLTGGGGLQERFTRIENCIFEDSLPEAGSVFLFDCDDVVISGCRFSGSSGAVAGSGRNLRIENCDISMSNNLASYSAVGLNGPSGILTNSRIRGGRVSIQASDVTVSGCDIASAYSSIYINGSTTHNAKIIGNRLETTGLTVLGLAGTEAPISCLTNGQTGHVIIGNRCLGGNAGINVQAGSTVSGNVITGVAFTGISVTLTGNTITGNNVTAATTGIALPVAATGNTVTGNRFIAAIAISNTGINNTISANFGTGVPTETQGAGSPESIVTAVIGSRYVNTTNGDIYRKTSGSAANGWVTP